MNTKTLQDRALALIDQYHNFKFAQTTCSIPYFNNKSGRLRAGLNVYIGKGSPREIADEIETIAHKQHIDLNSLDDQGLKKLLVDNGLGIDCSGFTYFLLNIESQERGLGSLDRHISFTEIKSSSRRLLAKMRPVRNLDVLTLASNKNSRILPLTEAQPGDLITIIGMDSEEERNHVLVIHQVEYQNWQPYRIHYSHVIAYPEDGLYGSGIRQGTIEIRNGDSDLKSALWIEEGKESKSNPIFKRIEKSRTELRRLNYF